MVLADGAGAPLGIHVEKASPAEVKLLEPTLDSVPVRPRHGKRSQPERLIGDRAYDSNPARVLLLRRHIEPIILARSNNHAVTHQDGRKLRRYKRRWIVERTNSWLQNFRRLVIRYENLSANFIALVHMACALVLIKRVLG